MLLRARIVFPVTAPPVEDGAVLVSGDRILAVGRWSDLRASASGPVEDLGEVVLAPGLVNAHCHLDYTHFAGYLAPPRSFTAWLQGVLGLKAEWSFSEFAASWLAGAVQLVRSGCTTVLDLESVPELLPEVWPVTPLRVISALELTGVRSGRPAEEIVRGALAWRDRLLPHPDGKSVALAPHAPYSTRPELMGLAARTAREQGLLLTSHVAESLEEYEMYRHARGPMHQWLRAQRDMSDCGVRSPVGHVAELGFLGHRCLLAHVNCLDAGEASLVARTGTAVVHCPRSHEYFGRPPFGYGELRAAGVNVCLGTDSLLSVRRRGRDLPVLDMRAEMKTFALAHPEIAPEEVVELATVAGARALGLAGECGGLGASARADLMAVPHAGALEMAATAILETAAPVGRVMIGGVWRFPADGLEGGSA